MKYEVKNCSACGRFKPIVNKTKQLCDECNYKRLHGGKTRFEVAKNKACNVNKSKRVTGEHELFKEIWSERSHYCVKCGAKLHEPMRVHYFSHIKSKGAHPELRLVKSNIELLCLKCHAEHEFSTNLI